MATPLDLHLNDVLRLKRPHPCGGTDWQVTRLGADIGLRCLTCNRRVLLERPVLEKRLKQFVSRDGAPEGQDAGPPNELERSSERRGESRLASTPGSPSEPLAGTSRQAPEGRQSVRPEALEGPGARKRVAPSSPSGRGQGKA